jgi:hypothetical protein
MAGKSPVPGIFLDFDAPYAVLISNLEKSKSYSDEQHEKSIQEI